MLKPTETISTSRSRLRQQENQISGLLSMPRMWYTYGTMIAVPIDPKEMEARIRRLNDQRTILPPKRIGRAEAMSTVRAVPVTQSVAERIDAQVNDPAGMVLPPNEHQVIAELNERLTADQMLDLRLDYFKKETSPTDKPQPMLTADQQYAKVIDDVITRAFIEEKAALSDFIPQRIKCCWRLVRELGRIKGMLAPDETLLDGLMPLGDGEDPWVIPQRWNRPKRDMSAGTAQNIDWDVVSVLKEIELLDDNHKQHWYNFDTNEWEVKHGLPLLPPPVPRYAHTDKGQISEDYRPENDVMLCYYVRVMELISQSLYIELGSANDKTIGKYGLTGVLDPMTVRLAMPSRMQLIAWEQLVITETLDLIVEEGVRKTKDLLFQRYGLQGFETANLIRLARKQALLQMSADVEEDRSVILMKLEDYVRRARASLDMRAELAGIKQAALVLGLGKLEPKDMMDEFIHIVKQVSGEREAKKMMPQLRELVNPVGKPKVLE